MSDLSLIQGGKSDFRKKVVAPLDEFPVDTLPEWVRDVVTEAAAKTGTTVSAAATVALGMVAASYHAKARIVVHDHWVENAGVYALLSVESGGGKSPLMKILGREIERYEEAEAIRRKEYRKRVARLKVTDEWSKEDREDAMPPTQFLVTVGDVTTEALERDLSEMNEALAIVTAEGAVLDKILGGAYSGRVADASIYCQGWSGEKVVTSRITRARVILRKPSLSMMVCAQPHVIRAIISRPEHQDQGVVGRMMVCEPPGDLGERVHEPIEFGAKVLDRWEQSISQILAIENPRGDVGDPCLPPLDVNLSTPVPEWPRCRLPTYLLRFKHRTGEQAYHVRNLFEKELAGEGRLADGSDLVSWGAKVGSHWARLAALHHVMTHPGGWHRVEIEQDSCEAAWEMLRFYFGEMMKVAKSGSESVKVTRVQEAVDRAAARAARRKANAITPGDIRGEANIGRGCVKTREDCDEAISNLVDLGVLLLVPEASGRGRRVYRYVGDWRFVEGLGWTKAKR